jgi:hypothetical protein
MTPVADFMVSAAAGARLQCVIAEFTLAVETGVPQRIALADFALRDAAQAAIAGLRVGDANAPMTISLLQDAIAVLRDSATTLTVAARGPQASLGQRIYMRMGTESGTQ